MGQKSAAPAEAADPEPLDAVEQALAEALRGATAAGQWAVVTQLARELEARRQARQGAAVVSIEAARAKRNGGQP